jgi:glyoxylase-like metal-dependent hydrolase (beta-lactamase superfamily II)
LQTADRRFANSRFGRRASKALRTGEFPLEFLQPGCVDRRSFQLFSNLYSCSRGAARILRSWQIEGSRHEHRNPSIENFTPELAAQGVGDGRHVSASNARPGRHGRSACHAAFTSPQHSEKSHELRAAGYQPEQVDEVLLTHLHADHVGGIAPGGVAAFPNAIVRSSKLDADYWLNDANEKAAHEFLHPMFEGDKASLKPYIASGRYQPFEGELEVVPGIRAMPTAGHTPSHTSYMIESRGHKLLVWGDIVHVAAIQFPDPSVTVEYDNNENQAEATRERIFSEAAKEGYWIGAAHISFPGLGHVAARGKDFVWLPGEYTTRMAVPVQ